jgi:hypothetical protein
MRKSVPGAIALSFVLLAGCQTAKPNLPPLVHIAPVECTGAPDTGRAASLPFDAEGKEKPLAFTIDMSSSCLVEGEAKSLYRIFALPAPGYSYMVTVRSLPSKSGILAPRLMMLDGDGQLLRTVENDTFLFRGKALVAMLRVQDGERFIAIASDPGVVGQDISRLSGAVNQQMISTGAFMFTVYTGSESTANLTYAHNGNMEIAARPIPSSE